MGLNSYVPAIVFYLSLAVLLWKVEGRRLRQSGEGSEQQVLLSFAQHIPNFQEIAKENHFKGWTATAGDPCSGDIQVERSSARECNPANSVYKSADRNPWTGVTCDSAGRVVCIELENLGLQGPVANIIQLSGLQDLAFLDLNNNQLSGPLPSKLGGVLSNLTFLYLAQNSINDSLPYSWGLSDFPQLADLHLQQNKLDSKMPASWGKSGVWNSLQYLNVASNYLTGSLPDTYDRSEGAWPVLQRAVLNPGNRFCGYPPNHFPAVSLSAEYLTGNVYTNISRFNLTCNSTGGSIFVPSDSDNTLGHDLSEGAVAGIITGEVLLGIVLLIVAGIFHRRYRWRQERSWVLFDWDVVQEPKPPRQFNFTHKFAWLHRTGSERSQSEGGNSKNFLFSPSTSANGQVSNGANMQMFDAPGPDIFHQPPPQIPEAPPEHKKSKKSQEAIKSPPKMVLPMTDWRDVMFQPSEVRLQQNADGSLKSLGNGSFGKVYKGVCQEIHECAVKVFEGYTGDQERESLLQEITILRSCQNANIVQFFGVCLQTADIWMVMELMEGNLYRHLARGHHCTWYFRGRSIALDIARGMEYLHSRKIIHMDLKSPNILIGETGIAKVADVGLARVMGSESLVNQMCAGTMHWMAPEVLVQGRCTEKADIFSFGVILWEICTGEAPTRGRMSCVSVPDECPQDVADLIEACMEEDSAKRPSAKDIINRIESIPITARPVPQPPWYAR